MVNDLLTDLNTMDFDLLVGHVAFRKIENKRVKD